MSKSTISTILKNQKIASFGADNRKRLRKATYADIEDALLKCEDGTTEGYYPAFVHSLADIEDLLCLEIFQYTRRDPLSLHGFLDIDGMDSGQFRTHFRFDKHDVRRLHRALRLPEAVCTPQCVNIAGVESLCLTLRRLAYPNRLRELEPLFGRHYSVISSATNAVPAHIESTFGHLLRDVNNHLWLDVAKLEVFSQVSSAEARPIKSSKSLSKGTVFACTVIPLIPCDLCC
ncbi:hypothetical protein HPB49_012865 [Dermacentor silvarum]|uniref:Uncharacterized protein n=1 Tax=Dermacentor silvarum TaxID=543639 RepID=A0ACB8DIS5_DERSI|nr:hypothetical protein HPB49_012865 [Dermacentor silvarum]